MIVKQNFNTKSEYLNNFLDFYLDNGFGVRSKREIDIYIFHLLEELNLIKDKSNYEIL